MAVILLAICLTGGIALYHQADQWTSYAIHKKMADEMITSTMENLRNTNYNNIVTVNGSLVGISTINVGGLSASETTTVTDETGGAGGGNSLKKVTVNITWSESEDANSDQREYKIVSYIAP